MINKFEGDYEFLSNFFFSPFSFKGIEYPTNEHFFQAMKTVDRNLQKAIAQAPTPGKAKRLGRQVNLVPNWETIKDTVMYQGLKLKFSDPILKEKLLATGNEKLEEGNWWHDNFWGNCYCPKCKNIEGVNKLGKLLMLLRKELKNEQSNT